MQSATTPNQPAQETKPQASFEAMSKEELVQLVAEKTREAKNLSSKNSKLQTKYIAAYKQNKLYKKDYESFMPFLKLVLGQIAQVPLGGLEYSQLEVMWSEKQSKINEHTRKIVYELTEEKNKMEAKYKRQAEEMIAQEFSKSNIEKLEKQLEDTADKLQRCSDQLGILERKNAAKEQELQRVVADKIRLEHQINSFKVNSTRKQLESTLSEFLEAPRENVDRTQILELRQHLQDSLEKIEKQRERIETLESKIKSKNKEIDTLKVKQENTKPTIQIPKLPIQVQTSKRSVSPSADKLPTTDRSQNKEFIQREYLKNVFAKFMKELNDGNQTQTEVLENVLMTILGFNRKERELAAVRRKQWWNFFR